jgi:flavin-dependent dehydrogenase
MKQAKGIGCDVLVAGGGPAGLAAAIALRLKGLDVLVADALLPPIDKACGEGLMPDSQRELTALGISISESDGARFEGIAFLSGNARVAAFFPTGGGIGIRRLRLHSLLVERAERVGVRLAWGARLAFNRGQPVLLNGETCAHRYLIGADGQSSRVRQWSGLDGGEDCKRRFGVRRHFRIRPWSRMVEVYWGDVGQAYVTPTAQDEVCVATLTRNPSIRMDAVLESMPLLKRRLEGAAPATAARGAMTATRKLRRVTSGNVLLIGDASGSADAVTGEGLALSFRQAQLLAEAVDANDLAIYEAGHPAILRLSHFMSNLMLSMDQWPGIRDRAIAALAGDPRLFGRMLATHLGEMPLSDFLLRDGVRFGWRMLMAQAL